MDKEEALVVFQKHIRAAEEQHEKDKQQDSKRRRRQERKIREAFMQFLHELHLRELITPFCSWSSLFPIISADERFERMLMQSGSTALDMFKFYVDDLKTQYSQDKHTIKYIVKDADYNLMQNTPLENFQSLVRSDDRGKKISNGNIKLTYNYMIDKLIEKAKEQEKETNKKVRILLLRDLLKIIFRTNGSKRCFGNYCVALNLLLIQLQIGNQLLRS